jgi:hypothetical protein
VHPLRHWRLAVLLVAAALVRHEPAAAQVTPPLADPQLVDGGLAWFQLNETRDRVRAALGDPSVTAPFGDFESWQYQIGVTDRHEFSHYVVFRQSTGRLISVARNFEEPRNVDAWFPPEETTVHRRLEGSGPYYGVRLRELSGGRVLMAMGSVTAGAPVGQILLILRSELRFFYPGLFEQLEKRRQERHK